MGYWRPRSQIASQAIHVFGEFEVVAGVTDLIIGDQGLRRLLLTIPWESPYGESSRQGRTMPPKVERYQCVHSTRLGLGWRIEHEELY
jgi:hypothetical protein